MNTIQILGRLGADPETRFTKSGQKVTSLRVASNVYQNGQDTTVWYRVTIWGEHPLIPHLKKGSAVVIVGELKKPEIYTDRNGQNQISLEVTAESVRFSPFGSGKTEGQSSGGYDSEGSREPATATVQGQGPDSHEPDSDDDLPF